MFASKFIAKILAAAFAVSAAPQASSGECNTGSLNCCNSVVYPGGASNATDGSDGLVLILISALEVPIGLTCSPISVVGVGAGSSGCTASPVCCDSTQENNGGLIGINCLPISISL